MPAAARVPAAVPSRPFERPGSLRDRLGDFRPESSTISPRGETVIAGSIPDGTARQVVQIVHSARAIDFRGGTMERVVVREPDALGFGRDLTLGELRALR